MVDSVNAPVIFFNISRIEPYLIEVILTTFRSDSKQNFMFPNGVIAKRLTWQSRLINEIIASDKIILISADKLIAI